MGLLDGKPALCYNEDMVNTNNYMTLAEVVEYLGISRQAVTEAAKPGPNRPARIRTISISRTKLYNRADVMNYKPRKGSAQKEASE